MLLAQLEPRFLQVAENAIHLFIDYQTAEGQLPFSVMDLNKEPHLWNKVFFYDIISRINLLEAVGFLR